MFVSVFVVMLSVDCRVAADHQLGSRAGWLREGLISICICVCICICGDVDCRVAADGDRGLAPGRIDLPNWLDSYQEPTTARPEERKGGLGSFFEKGISRF